MNRESTRTSVVRVGEARGFVVELGGDRFVITAAHCLPRLPPCYSASGIEDRTYANILGRLNEPARIWAECVFVDPIADIAVLGRPDNQAFPDRADDFSELTAELPAFAIADAADDVAAWLLTLDGRWARCRVQRVGGGPLWIEGALEGIRGGMSGSPICDDEGRAIGVCCTSSGSDDDVHHAGGPNPGLTYNLPGWLLQLVDQ